MKGFEERLKGGHHNSLGNTVEVVQEVLGNHDRFEELFQCYFSEDELVRLRVSSAIKRVCIAKKELVIPYIERLLSEIAKIDQASTQWTLALLFKMLDEDMTVSQLNQAKKLLKKNLENHPDWIVLNNTMETLTYWSKNDRELKKWLVEPLARLTNDPRKSVSGRAKKLLNKIKSN